MKLIVGLGNPGSLYSGSRHNIGFLVIGALAARSRKALRKERGVAALSAKIRLAGAQVILAKPLTFMNLSGAAVKALAQGYEIQPQDLLVVCDDLDLRLGEIRLKAKGSSGGHRGLESIIASLGNNAFCRLRLGIGRPFPGFDAAEYVLSGFTKEEKETVTQTCKKAVACCRVWASEGAEKAMNIFNRKGVN